MENKNKAVSSGYNWVYAHMNLQELWQCAQDLCKLKTEQIPALRMEVDLKFHP